MRALEYAFRQGWRGLRRSGSGGWLAVLAIAAATLALGVVLLITGNVERLVARWTSASEFSVFLRDDATSDQRGAIEAAIDASGLAVQRSFVSRDEAATRFRREFGLLAAPADALDTAPFPSSVEVQVRPNVDITPLTTRLATMPGVDDVRYDREWLASLASGLRAVRLIGWTIALILALAAAATAASIVRLGLEARRGEVEIMQLVGSPAAYVRGPFMAEGLLQGGFGAVVGLLVLWVGFRLGLASWGAGLAAFLDGERPVFIGPLLTAGLIGSGMLVGALGGWVASRHAR